MQKKKSIRIGLWGGVDAGKATYLTMLYRYLKGGGSEDWDLKRVHPGFSSLVEDYLGGINSGRFPKEGFSLPENYNSMQSFTYTLVPKKKSAVDQVVLSFLAIPGKLYESCFFENVPVLENQKEFSNAVEYYFQCDGIMMLLDPYRSSSEEGNSYHQLLEDFFTFLQRRWKRDEKSQQSSCIPHYFAFCLAKADLIEDLWNIEKVDSIHAAQKDLINLGKETLGTNTISAIRGSCYFDTDQKYDTKENHCRFYYLSSIGRFIGQSDEYEILTLPCNSDRPASSNDLHTSDSRVQDEETSSKYAPDYDSYRRPSDNIFSSKEKRRRSTKRISSLIKDPAHFEPLNLFSPLQWMINSISSNSAF